MKILPVIYRDGGFMTQPFAFGGEDGPGAFDTAVRYRSGLQNFLIDTGNEVILVDTGLPAGTPEESPDETTPIYAGHDVLSYMEALAALGYRPEQVSKILLTHKHSDHSGELAKFPNAQVWVNEHEVEADELAGLANIVPVTFADGPYKNFPESQKVAEGIWFIRAAGKARTDSMPRSGIHDGAREMGTIMEATELVLQTMHEAGVPLNAGKIAELSGLDRKVVDKAMKDLKASGAIVSPVRCKWEPAEK